MVACKEYEEGVTSEAMLVKDLDRFDMIFQAWEYEKGIVTSSFTITRIL